MDEIIIIKQDLHK